jgi:hypothetical protein
MAIFWSSIEMANETRPLVEEGFSTPLRGMHQIGGKGDSVTEKPTTNLYKSPAFWRSLSCPELAITTSVSQTGRPRLSECDQEVVLESSASAQVAFYFGWLVNVSDTYRRLYLLTLLDVSKAKHESRSLSKSYGPVGTQEADWIDNNYPELQAKYGGEWIAVYETLIAHGKDLGDVSRIVDEKGYDDPFLEWILPKDEETPIAIGYETNC